MQKHSNEIAEVLLEGIKNPAVASALHHHSEDYVTIIAYLLNSQGISEDVASLMQCGKKFVCVLDIINETL